MVMLLDIGLLVEDMFGTARRAGGDRKPAKCWLLSASRRS
jgi:hypothetical protein